MQLCFHMNLSSTRFAQKYLGKVTLREGKGTGPPGRCSPATPEHVAPSKVTSEAPSLVIPIVKKAGGCQGFGLFLQSNFCCSCRSAQVSAVEGMDYE